MPVHIDQMTTTLEFADPERERPPRAQTTPEIPATDDPRVMTAAGHAALASLAKAFEGFLLGRGM